MKAAYRYGVTACNCTGAAPETCGSVSCAATSGMGSRAMSRGYTVEVKRGSRSPSEFCLQAVGLPSKRFSAIQPQPDAVVSSEGDDEEARADLSLEGRPV